jgi:cation diffusion facilitator CzcD-associated flavoprotein CzcO
MRKGKIKTQKTSIKEFTENAVVLDNGESIECDVVILGTGYKANDQFLPESFQKLLDKDGAYLYRHILHPDLPDMAFIGRAATFSNSLTAHLSSVWLAHLLKGKFQLPETEKMFSEIELIKEWKRGFMPSIASRATVIKLHMIHFHDELLRDMSISPFRKKNLFLEWFADYRPSDYRKILSELDDS